MVKRVRVDEELVKQIKELKEKLRKDLGLRINDLQASKIYAKLNREFIKNIKIINNLMQNESKKKRNKKREEENILFGIKLGI